jgi:hypothetical protein
MIVFSCHQCRKEIKVKPELAGKKGKCPSCKAVVTVPGAANESKTLVGAKRGSGEAATLPPPARSTKMDEPKTLMPASTPVSAPVSGKTLLPSGPSAGSRRKAFNTLDWVKDSEEPVAAKAAEPDLEDPTAELTEFLDPPKEVDEIGRLGKYRVLNILGAGGMGVVFRAEDPVLKRQVALKALLPGMASSPSHRGRFLREAQAAAALQHDNVVTIYQVEDGTVPYLAMQLLEGEPLDERLTRETTLPIDDVIRIGRETAEGLSAAHERGMVHRDIKPANLFLESPKGRVKILDFGLARPAGGETKLTQMGAVVGTPGYLAPEQANGKPVDARGDLFSLGVVLYRLTTGELPFKGDDMLALLTALATTEPAPAAEVNLEVPATLSDLISRLLAKNPADRPASARAVAEELTQIAAGTAPPPARPMMALADDEPEEASAEAVSTAPRVVVTKSGPNVVVKASDRPMRKYDDAEAAKQKGFPWMVVGITGGALALVLVVGLVLFFVMRGKNNDDGSSSSSPGGTNNPNPFNPIPRPNPNPFPNPNPNPGPIVVPVPRPEDKSIPAWMESPVPGELKTWVAFAPDKKTFVTGAENGGELRFWDVDKDFPFDRPSLNGGQLSRGPVYSPDGKKLLFGSGNIAIQTDPEVRKQATAGFNAQDLQVLLKRPPYNARNVTFSKLIGYGYTSDNKPLAVFHAHVHPQAGSIIYVNVVIDVEKQAPVGNLLLQPQGTTANHALVGADGKLIVTIENQAIHLWDVNNSAPVGIITGPIRGPKSFALSPDGKVLLTSHHENTVRAWRTDTGASINSYSFGNGEFDFVGFSPDGKYGICSGGDMARIFNLETGEMKAELKGKAFMGPVAVSSDLTNVVASGWNVIFRYRIKPK